MVLEHLSRFPSSAIPRKDREAILDTVVGFIELESLDSINPEDGKRKAILDSAPDLTRPRSDDGFSMPNLLPLATHLMESPNLTSRLCTNPRMILSVANCFDDLSVGFYKASDAIDPSGDGFPILPAESNKYLKFITLDQLCNLEALASAVFKQIASASNVERRQEYHTELVKQLWNRCNDENDLRTQKVRQDVWHFFGSCSIIHALFSTIDDWDATDMRIKSLAVAFSRLSTERFQQVINLVERGDLREEHVFFNLWYALRMMNLDLETKIRGGGHGNATHVDVDNDGTEYQIPNFKLRELFLDESYLHRSDAVGKLPKELHQIQIEAYRLLTRKIDWNDAFNGALLLLRRGLDPDEYSSVLSIWLNFVIGEESPSKRAMELERLWRDEPDKQDLELLHVVIKSLEPLRDELGNKYTVLGTFLSGLLPKLCRVMRNASSMGEFCCSIACIQTILRTKVRSTLLQHHARHI